MTATLGTPGIRLGIFGGTFDPPHVGHLILGDEARYQLRLDRVLWVLTPFPPHKNSQIITPVENRLTLLRAAVSQSPYFEVNTTDLDRPPPHFAVDTLDLIRKQYPQATLVYLMGGDSLSDLPDWQDPFKFVAACDEIGVMRRPGEFINMRRLEKNIPGISRKVEFLEAPYVEISSSHIRQRVAQGGVYRYFLPERVFQLIEATSLYKDKT